LQKRRQLKRNYRGVTNLGACSPRERGPVASYKAKGVTSMKEESVSRIRAAEFGKASIGGERFREKTTLG